ncbi:hypothetical protein J6590_082354 [Homalodisca vitripennis]|nr:hypothetical protein J6590_082354 [Homalodisca vitripennis]
MASLFLSVLYGSTPEPDSRTTRHPNELWIVTHPPTPNWDFSAKSESDSFRERRILDSPPSGEVCAQSVKWEELSGESAQARGNHRGSPNHSVPVHELLMQRHNEVIATGGDNEWGWRGPSCQLQIARVLE